MATPLNTFNPGRLQSKVSIQQRAAGATTLGQARQEWANVATDLWAEILPLRGRELFAAGQEQQAADVRITLRWRAGITGAMRVVSGGVAYDIVGAPINVKGLNEWMELMCTTGVKDGR